MVSTPPHAPLSGKKLYGSFVTLLSFPDSGTLHTLHAISVMVAGRHYSLPAPMLVGPRTNHSNENGAHTEGIEAIICMAGS